MEADLSTKQNYSTLDRAVHRLAFSSRAIQLSAADVEALLYGARFRHVAVECPIFITSLPRAGTTLLLEIFDRLPGFATHRYRDMPFVLAPLLWDRLSGRFRKPVALKDRAHGDGMKVGYDSPEAFEEVIWRVFWPEKYRDEGVSLWRNDEEDADFQQFFVDHMKKVIALRTPRNAAPGRYVSKNNANVARIGLLRRLFPDGLILVPFRHPVDQAMSLLRQHRKFLALHRSEPFSKRYMSDIGHLEFGELHCPIQFDETNVLLRRYPLDCLDYWVAYWVSAFAHVIHRKDQVLLVSYERLCEQGATAMGAIQSSARIPQTDSLDAIGAVLRAPRRYDAEAEVEDRDLLDRALALHRDLLEVSSV